MLRCLNHLSNPKNTQFYKVGSCTDLLCAKVWEEKKPTQQRHSVTQERTRILSETRSALSAAKEADEETSFEEDVLNTYSRCVSRDLNSGVSETFLTPRQKGGSERRKSARCTEATRHQEPCSCEEVEWSTVKIKSGRAGLPMKIFIIPQTFGYSGLWN